MSFAGFFLQSVKMKSHTVALLICFLAFRVSAFPFGNPDLDLEWEDFKQRYNKNYELDGEEQVLIKFRGILFQFFDDV